MDTQLSRQERMALANRRTGLFIFQLSWIMVFVCLTFVNLQIRGNFASWPPEGVTSLNLFLPTLATAGLLLSAFFVGRGLRALRNHQRAVFLTSWQIALGLGFGFVAIMAYEWLSVPFSEQYSTIFRVMTGFHAVHALVIGIMLALVYHGARSGEYNATRHWAVEGTTKLWYFVVVAWMLFYVILYIV